MPRIRYHVCTSKRCRRVINRAGNPMFAHLSADEAILTASVRVSDGYRCPNCAPVRGNRNAVGGPVLGLAGMDYPTAAAVSAMVETPQWLKAKIDAEWDEKNPAVYMATRCNGSSGRRSKVAAVSRQKVSLTSAQTHALRAILAGHSPAAVDVDCLVSMLG